MKINLHAVHPWQVSHAEAVAIQERLAPLVREEPMPQPVQTVAGIDMSVRGERVQAAVVVVRLPDFALLDRAIWQGPVEFPYMSGLLSFREVPAVIRALEKLTLVPDLLMTDSQGKAHPRRMGLASHLGVLLDMPAVGVAKSRLIGKAEDDLPTEKGSHVPLWDRGEVVGALVRTRTGVNPVYVSIGHRITLPEAIAITLACTDRYKLPEPTRLAHLLSRNELE